MSPGDITIVGVVLSLLLFAWIVWSARALDRHVNHALSPLKVPQGLYLACRRCDERFESDTTVDDMLDHECALMPMNDLEER